MSLYTIQGKTEARLGIHYEFDSNDMPLGEGGMGKVYRGKCVDEKTGKSRNVAIKFIYSEVASPYVIEKARREAAIRIRHDNLVEMLGFIETESKSVLGEVNHHYHVVSELLEGVSLDKLFEGKLTDQQGRFVPFAEKLFKDYQQDVNHFAIEIIKSVLSGLMAMHDAGYIHRDIDPSNIMITSDGHIKLIDFGIAKKMNSLTTSDKRLTQTGQFVGKPEYASPELIMGAIDEQNQTTDIYAVGILLFQCIVGHIPFQGDRTEIIQKQLRTPMPLNLIKHKGLRKIIGIATDKSRAKRFQSAAEFRVALDNLDSVSTPSFEWKPMYNYIIGGVAACALLAIGFPYISSLGKHSESQSEVAQVISYPSALKALNNPEESSKALEYLTQLSDSGDGEATYLLSKLYFESKLPEDIFPDSIKTFKSNVGISADNAEAHRLLEKAVDQNPDNYHALFDLACDYWKAKQRTDAVEARDVVKAESYFRQALAYARKADDQDYMNKIDYYLKRIDQWKHNVDTYK